MNIKIFVRIFFITAIGSAIASCGGGDSLGGNITQFKTSYATATADTTRLEADLITGNTCTIDGSTGGTISTESVNITIATTNTTKGTVPPLPISISGYTVTFTPKNTGIPALTPLTGTFSQTIIPGTSAIISVPITTDRQKIDLIGADPSLPCSLNIYQYDVTVSFHAVEVGADDDSKTIDAFLVMAIADRAN